ncbi:hypothetical protein E8E14_008909 [Neopestalotiopsis sp. 37M]|nr:hypothetical protein E8E14_008909 [Neopestalotiopsis sp. 37M]
MDAGDDMGLPNSGSRQTEKGEKKREPNGTITCAKTRCSAPAAGGQRFCNLHKLELIAAAEDEFSRVREQCQRWDRRQCPGGCKRQVPWPCDVCSWCGWDGSSLLDALDFARNNLLGDMIVGSSGSSSSSSSSSKPGANKGQEQQSCQFVVAGNPKKEETLKRCLYPAETKGGQCKYHFLKEYEARQRASEGKKRPPVCKHLFCSDAISSKSKKSLYCEHHRHVRNRCRELGICRESGCREPALGVSCEEHSRLDRDQHRAAYSRKNKKSLEAEDGEGDESP